MSATPEAALDLFGPVQAGVRLLPKRIVMAPMRGTTYGGGAHGYTDYPTLDELRSAA